MNKLQALLNARNMIFLGTFVLTTGIVLAFSKDGMDPEGLTVDHPAPGSGFSKTDIDD